MLQQGDVRLIERRESKFLELNHVFTPGDSDSRMVRRFDNLCLLHHESDFGRTRDQDIHKEFVIKRRF